MTALVAVSGGRVRDKFEVLANVLLVLWALVMSWLWVMHSK